MSDPYDTKKGQQSAKNQAHILAQDEKVVIDDHIYMFRILQSRTEEPRTLRVTKNDGKYATWIGALNNGCEIQKGMVAKRQFNNLLLDPPPSLVTR